MERFNGVNDISIESGDMEDLLKKNEYLDIRDYVEEVRYKEQEKENQAAAVQANSPRGRRG